MRLTLILVGLCALMSLGTTLAVAQDDASAAEQIDERANEGQQPAGGASLDGLYEAWAKKRPKSFVPFELPEDATVTLRDDFEKKLSLPWSILRSGMGHFSLTSHEDQLTITTQLGHIHRSQDGSPARNIFLVENPVGGGDFCMTMKVSHFAPTIYFQQIALLCYDDDDNYLKWSYEKSWVPKKDIGFVLIRETDMKSQHGLSYKARLETFWTRVRKRGNLYECAFSLDGKEYEVVGQQAWSNGSPKYLGFLAKNGGNEAAGEIEAQIDWFEVKGYRSPEGPARAAEPLAKSVHEEASGDERPSELPETYRADFRNKAFDHDVLVPLGHGSVYGLSMLNRETNGLRIEVPAHQGKFKPFVGVAPALKIAGDFKITACYNLFSADRPDEGLGVGANLHIMTSPSRNIAMLRRCTAPDGTQAFMAYGYIRRPGMSGIKTVDYLRAKSSTGKLQLARNGGRLEFRVSDATGDFVTLHTMELGEDDITMLRLETATEENRAAVRVRWEDLTIAASELLPIKASLLERGPIK